MKKALLLALSVSFVFFLFLMLENDKGVKGIANFSGNSFLEGLKIVHKKDGAIKWLLTAKRADILEDQKTVKLYDIAMSVKENNLTFYTDSGTYDLSSRNLKTEKQITAKSKDYTITADSLSLESSSGELMTKGHIKFDGKNFKVEGNGLQTNSKQEVRILKDVKAIFNR